LWHGGTKFAGAYQKNPDRFHTIEVKRNLSRTSVALGGVTADLRTGDSRNQCRRSSAV
jgi:hypothetical protein